MGKKNGKNETVKMTPDQTTLIGAANRRIDNLSQEYMQVARQVGEIRDQLRLAEEGETKVRTALRQAEAEHQSTLNEIAEELGYEQGQSWQLNPDGVSFNIIPTVTEPGQKDSEKTP